MYESNWRTRGPLRPSQSPLQEPSIIQNTVGSSIFQVLRPWSLGLQYISFFFFFHLWFADEGNKEEEEPRELARSSLSKLWKSFQIFKNSRIKKYHPTQKAPLRLSPSLLLSKALSLPLFPQ